MFSTLTYVFDVFEYFFEYVFEVFEHFSMYIFGVFRFSVGTIVSFFYC